MSHAATEQGGAEAAQPSGHADSGKLPTGPEPVSMDVEYTAASQLQPLDDPARQCQVWLRDAVPPSCCLVSDVAASLRFGAVVAGARSGMEVSARYRHLQAMLRTLDSSDWTAVVGALTTARRLVAHHPDALLPHV